jgi:hypothetical protein
MQYREPKRVAILLLAVGLAAAVFAIGGVVEFFLALGCIGDVHGGGHAAFCREHQGGLSLLQLLVLFAPAATTLVAGAVSVARRVMMPVLVVGVLWIPMVVIVPAVVWGTE